MDIVLKNVSISALIMLKLGLVRSTHDLELEIDGLEKEYDSSSKYHKSYYLDLLKDKKEDLSNLRILLKQL